jgi:branched-chain amino acid transport system permease protein
LAFLTTVIVYAILALSYSFIYGQAGIASMGHATLYGVPSYAVAILAARGLNDPLLGLCIGALAGVATAWLTAWLFITATRLALAMLTIAVAQVFLEIANKATWLTGGDDGFTGYTIRPLLGLFEFDMLGRTSYWYAAVVLVLVSVVLDRIARSDFGLLTRAIKADPGRIESLGGNVRRHLMKVYCIAGAAAGIAGAINAQTAAVVSLDSLGFMVSINVLIMVVLGGTQRLYGAVVGAAVLLGIQHAASNFNPHHWLFVVGGLLLLVMLAMPGGLIGLVARRRPGP